MTSNSRASEYADVSEPMMILIPSEISVGHGDNEQGTGGRRTRNGYIEKTAGQGNDQTEN